MNPVVSIIIVSWNTRDLLAQCLASIASDCDLPSGDPLTQLRTLKLSTITLEVLVVDNASSDGSAEMVGETFPWVRLIQNANNKGFARANNQAVRESRGSYLLFLNPDTMVKANAIRELVHFLKTRPHVGAVGSKLLTPEGALQLSCFPAPTLSREFWYLFHLDAIHVYGSYQMLTWSRHLPREVDVAQGACLMLRREVLEQVGCFDEEYFIYSEEVDLCYRIRQAGWAIYWVPSAVVVHYGGQSTRQVATKMFLQLYRGKVLYFRKHHGPQIARLYKLILLMAALARLPVGFLALLERYPQRDEHLLLVRNYGRLVTTLRQM